MKRTRFLPPIPDAINASPTKNFTLISNPVLRSPDISFRAKGLLCLLLSNHENKWKSYVSQIAKSSKEGSDAILTGIRELEKFGYVLRLKYREKSTKIWRGTLWLYSDIPNNFKVGDRLLLLDLHGYEIPNVKKRLREKVSPEPGSPDVAFPDVEDPALRILNNKNTNKSTSSETEILRNGYIKPRDVFKFLKIYPSTRIGSKGEVITKWDTLCNNKTHRPTWNRIERAIRKQIETPRWQDPNFIPLATTWINQKRWLDDPALMVSYETDQPTASQQRKDKEDNEGEWARKFGYDKDEE